MTTRRDGAREDARLAEASEWFARLREENMLPEAIAEWLKWCDADPQNLRAYRGVQEIWALAGDAGVVDWPEPPEVRADHYDGDLPIEKWREPVVSIRARWRKPLAAAAAAVLTLSIGYGGYLRYTHSAGPEFSTTRGVERNLRLNDGSAMTLGAASAVQVHFNSALRQVQLNDGEAYFKVAADPSRPFVVRTRMLKVTAVGTAFTVRTDDVRTVVAVTEGKVEVAALGSAATASRTTRALQVGAGQQIAYDLRTSDPKVHPSDDASALGWRDGALTYVDEPMRAVVARINRYSPRSVELADPALGELRFTGTVFENQVAEWASGLERVFPLRAKVKRDGGIELQPVK